MTRDELIEAIARAIYERRNGYKCAPWSHGDHKSPYYRDATAALSAIEAAGVALVPVEPTAEMLDASLSALERAFDDLPADHEARAKGWVNGAKAGQRFKHRIRFTAMVSASPLAKTKP